MCCLLLLSRVDCAETDHCETIFTTIWQGHGWGGSESLSGSGSDLIQTATIRKELPALLQKYHCKVMVDAPCGDYYWMRHVELPLDKYIGADVVKNLIETNQENFGDNLHSFVHLDLTTQTLPKADLIFCRDCLVHFSHADIARAIQSFKQSGSTYLLTTGFSNSDPWINSEITTGAWRPLDLRRPPFNFPTPLEIINENCTEGWHDKSLFLWKIDELPDLNF